MIQTDGWFLYRIKIDTLLWIISIKVEDVGVNDSFSSLPYLSSLYRFKLISVFPVVGHRAFVKVYKLKSSTKATIK